MNKSITEKRNRLRSNRIITTVVGTVLIVSILIFIVKSTSGKKEEGLQTSQYNSFTQNNDQEQDRNIDNIKSAASSTKGKKVVSLPFSKLIETAAINDIKADQGGKIWLATEKGVYKLENNQLFPFTLENGKYPFPEAQCIEFDDQNLWVGSLYGLCRYDKSDSFIDETQNKQLPSNVIWDLLWDGSNLWISTQKGVTFSNANKESIVLNAENTNNGLSNSWCTKQARFANWYVVTQDNGISFWDINFPAANPGSWKNLDHTKSSISRPIHDIVCDGNFLWIGTPTGLMQLNTPVDRWFNRFSTEMISYTELHGLPSKCINTMIYNKNTLWLGTDNGLARIKNNQVQAITSSTGEVPQSIRKLAVHGDILWIGTSKGLQFINTAMIE